MSARSPGRSSRLAPIVADDGNDIDEAPPRTG
jgi:hypothetical protein